MRIHLRFAAVCLSLLMASNVYAQALPSNVGKAVGAAVAAKAIARGFAANDPSIAATGDAMGAAAAAAAGSAATNPWAAVIGIIGAGALMATTTPLYDDGPIWTFNPDGTVSVPGTSQEVGGTGTDGSLKTGDFTPIQNGNTYWYVGNPGVNAQCQVGCGGDPWGALQAAAQYYQSHNIQYVAQTCVAPASGATTTSCTLESESTGSTNPVTVSSGTWVNDTDCQSGMANSTSTCLAWVDPSGATTPAVTPESPASAAAALPASAATEPVSPDIMAATTNALWQQAANQSGYSGVPYDASDPVTDADASAVESASPSTWPDVADVTAPGVSTTSSTGATVSPYAVPTSDPATATDPSSGTSTTSPSSDVNQCTLNPNASGCAALGTPSASGTLTASGATVTLAPVSVGGVSSSSAVCPPDRTITALGTTLAFSYAPMCTAATSLRPVIIALCALVAGLIVVMGIKS